MVKMLVNTVISLINCNCVLTDSFNSVNFGISDINIISTNTDKVLFQSSIYNDHDYDDVEGIFMMNTGYNFHNIRAMIFSNHEADIYIDENDDECHPYDGKMNMECFVKETNVEKYKKENDKIFDYIINSVSILNHRGILRVFYNGREIITYDENGVKSLMLDREGNPFSSIIEYYDRITKFVYSNRGKIYNILPNMSIITFTFDEHDYYTLSLSNLFYDINMEMNVIPESHDLSRIVSDYLGFKFGFVNKNLK